MNIFLSCMFVVELTEHKPVKKYQINFQQSCNFKNPYSHPCFSLSLKNGKFLCFFLWVFVFLDRSEMDWSWPQSLKLLFQYSNKFSVGRMEPLAFFPESQLALCGKYSIALGMRRLEFWSYPSFWPWTTALNISAQWCHRGYRVGEIMACC